MKNAIEQNGVGIVRTPTGIGVMLLSLQDRETPVKVEVEYRGKRLKNELFSPQDSRWRDYLGNKVDHLKLVIRVKQGESTLAELGLPDNETCLPFMVRQGEQRHITENFVSIPPALTITDERGAVWTLGFKTAQKDQAPDGEFAFNVLRDGVDMGEIASRIERRNGQIRIFTRHGWKKWNQDGLYFV
jgi:hypothetical protein